MPYHDASFSAAILESTVRHFRQTLLHPIRMTFEGLLTVAIGYQTYAALDRTDEAVGMVWPAS